MLLRMRVPHRATLFPYTTLFRSRGVVRMKMTATGLLLLVAVIYVLAEWASHAGAGAWAGYVAAAAEAGMVGALADRKSTRLNSSHLVISYAVFCLKKKRDEERRW